VLLCIFLYFSLIFFLSGEKTKTRRTIICLDPRNPARGGRFNFLITGHVQTNPVSQWTLNQSQTKTAFDFPMQAWPSFTWATTIFFLQPALTNPSCQCYNIPNWVGLADPTLSTQGYTINNGIVRATALVPRPQGCCARRYAETTLSMSQSMHACVEIGSKKGPELKQRHVAV